jgi:hypothetical protein
MSTIDLDAAWACAAEARTVSRTDDAFSVTRMRSVRDCPALSAGSVSSRSLRGIDSPLPAETVTVTLPRVARLLTFETRTVSAAGRPRVIDRGIPEIDTFSTAGLAAGFAAATTAPVPPAAGAAVWPATLTGLDAQALSARPAAKKTTPTLAIAANQRMLLPALGHALIRR